MTGSVHNFSTDMLTEGLGVFDEVEELGSGNFGVTFRVCRDDDEYAVKVIHRDGLPEHLWDREVESLRSVEHPNVVAFRDAGTFTAGGREYPYLEFGYVPGGTLETKLKSRSMPDSPDELRAFLTGLLAGTAEIHDLGIIHRDIKPANIAIRDGDWGQPVLLDFGLARVLSMSSHTAYPSRIGTVSYMAPEQLRAKRARTRSDMFSIGVVVSQLGLSGPPVVRPSWST